MKSSSRVNFNQKILIFGHKGLIGSALLNELKKRGYKKTLNKKNFEENIKYIYNTLNEAKLKKFEKNTTFNLPV